MLFWPGLGVPSRAFERGLMAESAGEVEVGRLARPLRVSAMGALAEGLALAYGKNVYLHQEGDWFVLTAPPEDERVYPPDNRFDKDEEDEELC